METTASKTINVSGLWKEHGGAGRKRLRDFGGIMAGFFTIFFIVIPLVKGREVQTWALVTVAFFATLALVFPLALKPLYQAWMIFGSALGWVNTRLILGVVFFLVITPIGLFMRALGHDPLDAKFNKGLPTYRKTRKTPKTKLEHQF